MSIISGQSAHEILKKKSLRPSMFLLSGDIVTFPSCPEIVAKPLGNNCVAEMIYVKCILNNREKFMPLKQMLGLDTFRDAELKSKYANASALNHALSECFDFDEAYNLVAGHCIKVAGVGSYSIEIPSGDEVTRKITKTFPILKIIL